MIQTDWNDSIKVSWEQKIMAKHARRARIYTMGGYIGIFICFLGFMLSPLIGVSFRTINNITDLREGIFLPVQTSYPFDYSRSPIFMLVYMTQVGGAFFLGVGIIVPNFFFGTLVFHACARCEILQKKTKALLKNKDVDKLDSEEFRIELSKIVKSHLRIIR